MPEYPDPSPFNPFLEPLLQQYDQQLHGQALHDQAQFHAHAHAQAQAQVQPHNHIHQALQPAPLQQQLSHEHVLAQDVEHVPVQATESPVSSSDSVPLIAESQKQVKKRKTQREPSPPPPGSYQPAPEGHFPISNRAANKAALAATAAFNDAHGIPYRKTDLYTFFNVPRRTGSRTLKRARISDADRVETRGRKPKITEQQMKSMDDFLERELWEGRTTTWSQVGAACGVDASDRTIQRHMGSLDYSKCIVCLKGYVNRPTAIARVEFATRMLERFPTKEDWRRVRFSDDVHFGFGPNGQAHIIRKLGQRYCPDCIDKEKIPHYKDERRVHAWAAFGYDFKSHLVFFENKAHKESKLSSEIYRDLILETEIKRWIDEGHNFILEEEGDAAHGQNAKNIVRDWKDQHQMEYYFNVEWSPDLAPITTAWNLPKDHVVTAPAWNDSTTKELALSCWNLLSQETINDWCDSMPDRLREVIASEGRMTAH